MSGSKISIENLGVQPLAVDLILRKAVAVITGILFLVVAGVIVSGLGLLSSYPLWMRLVTSLIVAVYGLFRVKSGWTFEAREA